ncbi:ABC transporter substrate-binding protein [Dechloromonas sp. ZY10]|uniref:ABC transporter substrate-binding protein n=1 Tax=Dechloromonas aquae TaxID=2664436 RepID=UPI003529739B
MRRLFATSLLLLLSASAVAEVRSQLDRILADKTLRVCVWPDYFGISYRDPKNRQLTGIDVDLAKGLARDLGVGLEFIDSSFARLIPDVLENRCDIAMFAIGITPQRQEKLRFTQPHLASDIFAITSQSNRRIKSWADIDKPGVVVAVAKGTLHEPVMRDKLKAATLKVFDTPQAREQEVESGRADVFMTDYPFSRRMLKTTDWARVIRPDGVYHVTPYAWALRPGDDRWHGRVEQYLLQARRNGELKAAAERHDLLPIALLN